MKTIKIQCSECQTTFERSLKEHTRSIKLNRPEFCSGTCSTIRRNKELTPEERAHCYDISRHAGDRQDEFSPFRKFLSKGRSSIKRHGHGMNIDVEYLRTIWNAQNGVCPYTGIKMLLPKNTSNKDGIHSLKKASLDRIDSSKGYIKGNVEFVCQAINLAKNSFTREEMKEFISEIGGDEGSRTLVNKTNNT